MEHYAARIACRVPAGDADVNQFGRTKYWRGTGDYWVIGLAPDSWAVVADPGREYLWILTRTPRLAAESIAAARTAAQDNGFDVERLVQTPQATGGP